MLKLKYLFENFDLVKEALKNWAHDEASLDETISHFRISSNAVYPFFNDGKICFLRLAPVEEKTGSNVAGELEFVSYLNENGFPALPPLKAKSGETLLILDTRWEKYYASAFGGVDGTPIEDVELTENVMLEYGRTLGDLHALSRRFVPETRKWTHDEALGFTQRILTEYDAPRFALDELGKLKRELSLLPKNDDNYGLVHYDFEPDNVFFDERTGKCSVIDFDDGMYHWYALDIAQVFDSLEDYAGGEALETAKALFLKGYRERFPFTDDALKTIPIMLRFTNIFGYARILRSVYEKFDNEPDWLRELRVKLDNSMRKKEKLMQNN